MSVRVLFGVRHHGPGSARSLRTALETWSPDIVLVEGAPEGTPLMPHVGSPSMRPPIALLVYAPTEPQKSAFWPFAVFSPEWQAITFALSRGVPARFVDLPAAQWFAGGGREPREAFDPIAALAELAGYTDAERWWDDMIEHRLDGDAFDAVAEAMTALREDAPPPSPVEARREASMRQGIRGALREGFTRVAVVCGAWHVLALQSMPSASSDAALLRGLPKVKVAATWVPWTYGRLSFASGYGAGVLSPGWYDHLFSAPDAVVTRWLTKVAGLLRGEDLDASSGAVIDAVRLAEALATLRGRPLAGLEEVTDATRAVLGGGSDVPMSLVGAKLVVGERLGEVPDDTPMVPLQQDLTREHRRLRLRASADARLLDLDLRRPNDLARSHLLHRLDLLDVPWGVQQEVEGKLGTFHELWYLQWDPELSVALIEASMWGTTVVSAAAVRACEGADKAMSLADVTRLVSRGLLADLPDAIGHVMRVLADRVALDRDVGHLMDAMPPLALVLRYGNVRQTDAAMVATVFDGLVTRVAIGLPHACASLDDDAAAAMVTRIGEVHSAIALLDRPDLRKEWEEALLAVASRAGVHGLLVGRCLRLLLDGGALPSDEVARRMALSLSPGEEPRRAAAWVEGFLTGSALMLLHDEKLLGLLDGWLVSVKPEAFTDVLPLLRRTFSTFEPAERRQIGSRLSRPVDRRSTDEAAEVDVARAELVLPVVARLLGIEERS